MGDFEQLVNGQQGAMLKLCPNTARIVTGDSMPRPVEETPVITGFILTVTFGYLGFSVALLAGFCIVQASSWARTERAAHAPSPRCCFPRGALHLVVVVL